jgi:hypothetical protein
MCFLFVAKPNDHKYIVDWPKVFENYFRVCFQFKSASLIRNFEAIFFKRKKRYNPCSASLLIDASFTIP